MQDILFECPPWPPLTLERGKVRDAYLLPEGERLIVTTDRLSAFDAHIGAIPCKGQVLNQLSVWWFDQLGPQIPHHFLSTPDPNAMRVRACTPLAVEFVMRGYLTGVTPTSIWTAYERGERSFCGHTLPDGLKCFDALPTALLTPSTKAPRGGSDQSVSGAELIASGVIDAATFERASELAHATFALGQRIAESRGLILVDTKYEFGIDAAGELRLIDEVHTPDSSRFWRKADYAASQAEGRAPESFDKEYVRRCLKALGYQGQGSAPPLSAAVVAELSGRYVDIYETLTGLPFVPSARSQERIAALLERITATLEA